MKVFDGVLFTFIVSDIEYCDLIICLEVFMVFEI